MKPARQVPARLAPCEVDALDALGKRSGAKNRSALIRAAVQFTIFLTGRDPRAAEYFRDLLVDD